MGVGRDKIRILPYMTMLQPVQEQDGQCGFNMPTFGDIKIKRVEDEFEELVC